MFLYSVQSNDSRFKPLYFHEGLNLVVARRTLDATIRDSRNGTGKSSFTRILRYLLGGSLAEDFKVAELKGHAFLGEFDFPSSLTRNGLDLVRVNRPISPTTQIEVNGWTAIATESPSMHVDRWRELIAESLFGISRVGSRLTSGQLWGQLIRNHFQNPIKTHQSEPDWESGLRIGYFLGLDPTILSRHEEIVRLRQQKTAIQTAVKEGAITTISLDEASLRSQLADVRRQRDRTIEDLGRFKVDERYADHQSRADTLTSTIKSLNEQALIFEERARELRSALEVEQSSEGEAELGRRLARLYAEVQVVLPEVVSRRFDEVTAFHQSVVRNRRAHLLEESRIIAERLETVVTSRRQLDEERSAIMRLLNDSVALDTFVSAQRSLGQLEADVVDLERQLRSAVTINSIDTTIKSKTAEAVSSVRSEIEERSGFLDRPISLFKELGREIYNDREADLLISPSETGFLRVRPRIDGDHSEGIRGVETFLLDIVCIVSAIGLGRAPRILVHDSHLFDSTDHRQVSSCLGIAARLSQEYGFQYIVTINSDVLASVETEGGFDSRGYLVDTNLTDEVSTGGLFGFHFD